MQSKKERWKPIPRYENRYEISSFGRVRTIFYYNGFTFQPRRRKPRLRIQHLSRSGYPAVILIDTKGQRREYRIHRLVLEAFNGQSPKGFHGAHLDGNRFNNNLKNLKWVSPWENQWHRRRHGTAWNGETAKLNREDIPKIRELYNRGCGITQLEIANKFGVSRSDISYIINNKTWKDC